MTTLTTIEEDAIIRSALEILDCRLRQPGQTFDSPAALHKFLRLLLAEPSRADEVITSELKAALALVDVRVLDHFIVPAGKFRFPLNVA